MAYEVYLGGCALYGVSSVEESVSRNVTEHDAINSGAFTIPQNAGLKNWSIKLELTQQNLGQDGWSKASTVLEDLTDILHSKKSRRLIIISDRQKLSKPALLKDVKYETSYQGVYSVSLSLIQYVKAQVKTTAVPTVSRDGTRPETPTTFKIASAYDEAKKAKDDSVSNPDTGANIIYTNDDGEIVNPAGLENEEIVRAIREDVNSAFITEQQKEEAAVNGVMTTAYSEYESLLGSE